MECVGLHQVVKHKEMKVFLRKNKVHIMTISKHRVKNNIASSIINKVLPRWDWYTNATTTVQSRLWVFWNPDEVKFSTLEGSAQHIHGVVRYLGSGRKFQFRGVYGLHTIEARSALWTALRRLEVQTTDTWVYHGEF